MDDEGALVLGTIGVVLATLSLALQGLTHLLTGGRAKVSTMVGRTDERTTGIILVPDWATPTSLDEVYDTLFYPMPVFVVSVRNRGRMPITVQQIGFRDWRGYQLFMDPFQLHSVNRATLPCRIDAYDGQQWAVPLHIVGTWIANADERVDARIPFWATPVRWLKSQRRSARRGSAVFAFVQLSDGRERESWKPVTNRQVKKWLPDA